MSEKKTSGTLSVARQPRIESNRGADAPKPRSGERARRAALRARVRGNDAAATGQAKTDKAPHAAAQRPHPHPLTPTPSPSARERGTKERKNVSKDRAKGSQVSPLPLVGEGTPTGAGEGARGGVNPGRERAAASTSAPTETHPVFAPCPQGLEAALASELHALGYSDARIGRAGVHFRADWAGVMRANLYSRLATRILVQVAHAPVAREDDILALAAATPWERWFGPEHRLRVDTSAIQSPMQSLHYCNLRAKDGVCDRLRAREGARPDIDTVRPDARVHLFLSRDAATLYLDTSGESLFKRGWRLDKGAAPLRENLAAGLLALAGWRPEAVFLDPFCGSGTLAIEAAGIALNLAPGGDRPFAFARLRGFDARAWQDIKDAARAQVRSRLPAPIVGADNDALAIASARANAERAGLASDAIDWRLADARSLPAPASTASPAGWIVTNPPYGERLEVSEDALWRDWASQLKRHYGGWQLAIISNDPQLPQRLRLKPRLRTPVRNGALDCRLFQFDLVAAGYRG